MTEALYADHHLSAGQQMSLEEPSAQVKLIVVLPHFAGATTATALSGLYQHGGQGFAAAC